MQLISNSRNDSKWFYEIKFTLFEVKFPQSTFRIIYSLLHVGSLTKTRKFRIIVVLFWLRNGRNDRYSFWPQEFQSFGVYSDKFKAFAQWMPLKLLALSYWPIWVKVEELHGKYVMTKMRNTEYEIYRGRCCNKLSWSSQFVCQEQFTWEIIKVNTFGAFINSYQFLKLTMNVPLKVVFIVNNINILINVYSVSSRGFESVLDFWISK